jgi:diadenosine tetraphosphatase ApaH/serine/threonine PP2A family protein phosphatase
LLIAALYDIHANLPALEAVLAEIQMLGVEQVVIGGDVLPGPMPKETLIRLRELKTPCQLICGNGEVAVLDEIAGRKCAVPDVYRPAIHWNAEQMDDDLRRWVAEWPLYLRIGNVLFCHATPRNENEIFTRRTPEEALLPVFSGVDASVVVCGHTHMQFDRTIANVRVLNAGSVGMPFGHSGADWLLLGDTVEFRHTEYDLDEAAERILATRYPMADDFAANNVLTVPSEEKMLELLGRAEIKSSDPVRDG